MGEDAVVATGTADAALEQLLDRHHLVGLGFVGCSKPVH
jgi:hypothetical protein